MTLAERIGEFLQRLTPMTRSNLLTELERLESSDDEMPGSSEVLTKLRAELRKDGSSQNRASNSSRYFFAPLEPLLIDSAPVHANSGRILRGSLTAIWDWISRDLLPTMARDYVKKIDELIAADNQKEARKEASTFQTKVVKYLESTLSSADRADQTRARLAVYTASPVIYDDLVKMQSVLRARDALAKFDEALPTAIQKFDDAQVAKIEALLNAFRKNHAEAVPFALALVAKRLKTPWQLVRLATKAAPSKNAADVAATPYAIVVSMVLDRLDDKRSALRVALKNNRVLVSKEILTEIYDTEYALQVRIDHLDQSEWGIRLSNLMNLIAVLVEAELARFPEKLGHVLGSRRLRTHQSLAGRLTYIAYKGRDAVSGGAAHLKKLIGQPEKTRA
jgi:flagellin-specific chaperone FliS